MVSKSLPRFTRWLGLLLLIAVVAGCGSDGGGGGTAVARPGTVSVSLTDAPACGYEAVVVTVREVRIHQSSSVDDLNGAGWRTIVLDTPRPINLLDLNDPTQPNFALHYLGETPLPAGHYTQLRLVLEENRGNDPSNYSNYIVLEGEDPINDRKALETPSALRSGLKLIHQFTVNSGQRVDLLLDFDACHSIVQTGNNRYKLKPVIKVIPYVLNGIEGYLDLSLFPGRLNTNHVAVSAQVGGEIVRTTMPNPVTGRFLLGRLVPGDFDVVITADNRATAVITGVPVPTSEIITPVSTTIQRIPLGGSPALEAAAIHSIGGTVLLVPPPDVSIEEPTVFVSARQTLDGGQIVTVKSIPATLLTPSAGDPRGDYHYDFTLPTGAPSVGPYVSPLPVTFTRQSVSVGVNYAIQAAALGYQTQQVNIPDISGVVTQDITLPQ